MEKHQKVTSSAFRRTAILHCDVIPKDSAKSGNYDKPSLMMRGSATTAGLDWMIFNSDAERPKYRLDYRYEKAFNNFYKLHATATTWAEARIRCQAEGTQLLVPDTLDEADAVPLLVTPILNKFEGIFVGIHDLYSERSFVTLSGQEIQNSILNLLWEYKEPLYRQGRCVAMRRTGRIFVHPCGSTLPFICKISGSKIEFFDECSTYDKRWILGPNNTCYFMHIEPQTWSQAFATCLSAGGHLAILNNQSEADHLKTMFKQHQPRRMPTDDFAFLGYSDIFQRHHYRTVEGELVVDLGYKEWEISCPEPYNATSALRCGGMRRHGLLAIGDCNIPAMFFCEKPAGNNIAKNILRVDNTRNHGHKHGHDHNNHQDRNPRNNDHEHNPRNKHREHNLSNNDPEYDPRNNDQERNVRNNDQEHNSRNNYHKYGPKHVENHEQETFLYK